MKYQSQIGSHKSLSRGLNIWHLWSSLIFIDQAIPGQTTILVVVEGLVKFDGNKAENFSQNFILTAKGNTVWKVASDCFRFFEWFHVQYVPSRNKLQSVPFLTTTWEKDRESNWIYWCDALEHKNVKPGWHQEIPDIHHTEPQAFMSKGQSLFILGHPCSFHSPLQPWH